MKTVTSTVLSSVLFASALLTHSAFAANVSTTPEKQLITTINTSLKQQANEMYYGTKAEILASVQQQLNQLATAAAVSASNATVTLVAGEATKAGTSANVSNTVIVAQDNH
ncbi:hypothetical protein [Shewanella sp.]|uniref:hypothetical protein n=1 Tax=Shewanella sp. TaxID=50422 RepID=UPI003A985A6A